VELSAKNFDEPDETVELPGLVEEVVASPRAVTSAAWRCTRLLA